MSFHGWLFYLRPFFVIFHQNINFITKNVMIFNTSLDNLNAIYYYSCHSAKDF